MPTVTLRPTGAPMGVEIDGVNVAKPMDVATFHKIREALYKHSLIIFRSQNLNPQDQVAFGRRFGELEVHVLKEFLMPGLPEVLVISNIVENGKPIGVADGGRVAVWHTDSSYVKDPSAASLLYGIEIPHDDAGLPLGDTEYASTFAAYDALPESMKKRLEGLKAIHRVTKGYEKDKKVASATRVGYTDEQRAAYPDQHHPLVRTHPVTGRKCIFINKVCVVGIAGMPDSESEPLLEELYQHCTQEQFIYRHKWKAGDLLMWDNCSILHRATHDYPGKRRRMHHARLKGRDAWGPIELAS